MAHPIGNEHRGHKVERDRVSHIAGVHEGERPIHRARGGKVGHSDEAEDKALIKKSIKKACMRADGGSVKARADKAPRRAKGGAVKKRADGGQTGRQMDEDARKTREILERRGIVTPARARGGHVKGHKGAKTNVNVIVAPSGGQKGPMAGMMPPPPPAAGAMPPPMPPKPPMAPPPMPVGMAGPPGPGAGGIPMRKRGGAVDGKKSMADQRGVTGIGARTPIQHSGNKSDTQNIGRGPVITRQSGGSVASKDRESRKGDMAPKPNQDRYGGADLPDSSMGSNEQAFRASRGDLSRATGGKIEAYGAKMSPTFPHKAGAGSGVARKAKAHMGSARHGMVP